jgi:hypothetical protein
MDCGLVHEDIVRAVVGGDEAQAFMRAEPLHLQAIMRGVFLMQSWMTKG